MIRVVSPGLLLFTAILSSGVVAAETASPQPEPKSSSEWPSPVGDSEIYGFFLADILEYNTSGRAGALEWDFMGWRGGDSNRLWFKSEGEQSASLPDGGIGDLQLLYGRMIAPFFDLQMGLELDNLWGGSIHSASRLRGVVGLQGLAPYSFDFEPTLFVSQTGDIAFRISASDDFLFTQRAMVQLRVETNVAVQSVERFGVAPGLNDLTLGIRLRYEIVREFAPYAGVTWSSLFGARSSFEQEAGPDVRGVAFVAGFRAWY